MYVHHSEALLDDFKGDGYRSLNFPANRFPDSQNMSSDPEHNAHGQEPAQAACNNMDTAAVRHENRRMATTRLSYGKNRTHGKRRNRTHGKAPLGGSDWLNTQCSNTKTTTRPYPDTKPIPIHLCFNTHRLQDF